MKQTSGILSAQYQHCCFILNLLIAQQLAIICQISNDDGLAINDEIQCVQSIDELDSVPLIVEKSCGNFRLHAILLRMI
jgi:hypothetical protein